MKSPAEFEQALAAFNLNVVTARDMYNGIIFLDTAALGAEDFYTLDNNAARYETPEEARTVNERTYRAWVNAPHLKRIENRPGQSFKKKIHECLRALARILGVPEPLEQERKFLLHNFDPERLPVDVLTPVDIRQTYLIPAMNTETERVRVRGQNNHWLHFHTRKVNVRPGVNVEADHIVDRDRYDRLLYRANPAKLPIVKTRTCLTHAGQYCELDRFAGHRDGLVMLEIEVDDINDDVEVPPYLGAYTDVTDDPAYSNYRLADPV